MIIIVGLIIFVAAVIVGVAGVLGNGGTGHAVTHPFAVFGYHVVSERENGMITRSASPGMMAARRRAPG
jgi:hypothetical protein